MARKVITKDVWEESSESRCISIREPKGGPVSLKTLREVILATSDYSPDSTILVMFNEIWITEEIKKGRRRK